MVTGTRSVLRAPNHTIVCWTEVSSTFRRAGTPAERCLHSRLNPDGSLLFAWLPSSGERQDLPQLVHELVGSLFEVPPCHMEYRPSRGRETVTPLEVPLPCVAVRMVPEAVRFDCDTKVGVRKVYSPYKAATISNLVLGYRSGELSGS